MRARNVARYAAESGITLGVSRLANSTNESLGDARFSVVVTNLNARIDLGRTDTATIRGLFEQFIDRSTASEIARDLAEKPLQRLGELALRHEVPEDVASAVAPFVTVWGDGSVDTTAAPEPVRAALSSSAALVSAPTRVLIVSRGWLNGFPLTHEIQAVYAIGAGTPQLVAWQERDL